MGWDPAVTNSGDDWLAPWLSLSLHDRYSAVRFIAYRSLRQIEGFTDFEYDYVAALPDRRARAERALALWEEYRAGEAGRTGAELLIDETGALRRDLIQVWLARRDHRSMDLQE